MPETLNHLLGLGSILQTPVRNVLDKLSKKKVSLRDLFFRSALIEDAEKNYHTLFDKFLEYERSVSDVIRNIPATINERIMHECVVVSISTQRDSLRALLRDISSAITGYREEVNFYRALIVSVIALVIAVTGLIVSLVAQFRIFWK